MTHPKQWLTLLCVTAIFWVPQSMAATLRLQPIVTLDNTPTAQLPVHLDTREGDFVASLQFDIHFDPQHLQFRDVETGTAAAQSDKSAHFNQIQPDVIRVVVAGLNRTVITPGTLSLIVFDLVDGAAGTTSLRMDGAILSDPFGTAVPATLSPHTLVLETRGGTVQNELATGTSNSTVPNHGYNTYPAFIVALLGVGAAMLWARKSPRKRGRR